MLGNISIWQLLIVLLIVALIFGTRRLRSMGSDLGGALGSFRKAMKEVDDDAQLTDESGDKAASPSETRDRVES